MVLTFDAKVPQLEIKGNYNMEGKILVIPVKGKGTCSMISSKYSYYSTPQKKTVIFHNFQPTSKHTIVYSSKRRTNSIFRKATISA